MAVLPDRAKKALQSERSREYDALHYRIAIRLDLDEKSFAGQTTVTLTSLRDGLDMVVLDAEEFAVTAVVSEWGDPLALAGLAAAARSDPFWAVRRGAIEALARAGGAQGPAVMTKAALDAHPSVRAAALVALGDLKDRSLREFFKERFAKDGSDAVRAESLRALGKLGDPAAVPFLERCAAVPSYRNLIATAAKQASDREVREFYQFLSNWEQQHYDSLQNIFSIVRSDHMAESGFSPF